MKEILTILESDANQSDCIERQFGANYYASVRQFIEAEKIILLKSLMKYSNLDLQDLKGIFKDINTAETAAIDSEANLLLDKICTDLNANYVTEDDKAILFYISGYICRSLTKQVKCASCHKLLVKDSATPSLTLASDCPHDENEVTSKENFLNTINRGGLCTPANPRSIFLKVFIETISSNENTAYLCDIMCEHSHPFRIFLERIAKTHFNMGSKNYVSEINSRIHSQKKRPNTNPKSSSVVPKQLKLQSDAT